jgi:hypothetical protein
LDRYAGRWILINGIRTKFGPLSTVDVQVECAPEYGSVVNGIFPDFVASDGILFSSCPIQRLLFLSDQPWTFHKKQQTSAAFLSSLIAAEYRADEDINWAPVQDILLLSRLQDDISERKYKRSADRPLEWHWNNLSVDLCHMKEMYYFLKIISFEIFNEFNQL